MVLWMELGNGRRVPFLWTSCGSVSLSVIVTGGKDSAHEVEWALKFAINSLWRTIWRACLSSGTALSVESMAAQRLDWARRYLGMIPSLSRPTKQTSPDKPQSRDIYKNVACPLVFFADLNALPHGGFLLFHSLRLWVLMDVT